ncbi:MAG: DDE-type integrase/transposase/recombinase [Candidatus Thiodiazotropha taylori]|nr:DDE-type integrase/transposase/recombinase [Candidatus Thiodiazotropha taylori]
MHRRVYQALKKKPPLIKKNAKLQSVSGACLKIDGYVTLRFKIGDTEITHPFYVSPSINRNFILGRDWLVQNGVRLYFDLGFLRIGETRVPLEEDIHIASLVRVRATTILKPQTATVCVGKVKDSHELPVDGVYSVTAIETNFICNEPGLMISNSIAKLNKCRSLPIMVVNQTNKTMKVKRGCVIATIEAIDPKQINGLDNIKTKVFQTDKKDWTSEVDVPENHKPTIVKFLQKHHDLFAVKDSELGHTDTVKMKLDTGDHPPIKLRPYRAPIQNREVIEKAVDEMLDANVIRRSKSPWSFPVVIVDKKDGSKRFCVDFRKLNQITKPNSYPLPLIDDILALLGKAKYFTSLDLKSGYWQVLMDETDKEKTAFACHRGLFEFNVMPFGLSNAPAIFQELMAVVLQGLGHFATAYLDDILIFSETLEKHLSHLEAVFDRLCQHGLKLKLKKCSFLQSETHYLGFIINSRGISPDPLKVEAIRSLPTPTCVREVRSFIGMSSYYRRFIPNFSEIAEPIIALTRKYARFKWSEQCQNSFDYLKQSLTVVPLLAYPDPNKPYTLYTDASNSCIGACLTQEFADEDFYLPNVKNEKPIYYLSHKLSKTQCKWSTIEKEAYAIHYSLQKLDYYLHNAKFTIKTDHKPLKYLLESQMQNKKIQLWALGISGYNCTIEYISGTENTCADLLSRKPDTIGSPEEKDLFEPEINDNTFEVGVINSNQFNPKDFAGCSIPANEGREVPDSDFKELDMALEQGKDQGIVELKTQLEQGEPNKTVKRRYLVEKGLLYYLSNPDDNPTLRLFIPEHLRHLVVTQYHDGNGHMGVQKTFDTIRQKYFWPNLFQEIYEYVSKCVQCQARSSQNVKPLLQNADIPPYAMAKLSLDLSGPYPKTLSGNKYIIAFVDWYSGWPEAFAVPDKTAETVAHLIIEEIFPRFGSMLELVTDNGSENVNRVVKETLDVLNVHHVTTSFYHPCSNSKVERFHRTLHDILAKRLQDAQDVWDLHLNQVLAAVRFNVSEATEYTPYYLLYGRDVVLPLDNILKPRLKYQGEDMHQIALQEQHKAFMLVHGRLRKQQRKQAKYGNKNRKDVIYNVGDPVFYKKHVRTKIEGRWRPYYRVIEQKSPVTYVLKNQMDNKSVEAHANDIKLAKIDAWHIPKIVGGQPRRRAAFVVPPVTGESSSETNSSESESENPKQKLVDRARHERENSDAEDFIPKMELAKHIREREREGEDNEYASDEMLSANDIDSEATIDYDLSDSMMVESIQKQQTKGRKPKILGHKTGKSAKKDRNAKFKTLFSAIAGMF